MNKKKAVIIKNNLEKIQTASQSLRGTWLIRGNESKKHFMKKMEVLYDEVKEGKTVLVEATFKNNLRSDLFIASVPGGQAIEVVMSEKEESIARKRKDYPCTVTAVRCRK